MPGVSNTKTDTVAVDASGEDGPAETYSLGKEYNNIISVEWTGPGIQPTDGNGGPGEGPPAEGFGDNGAFWYIALKDSESGSSYRVAEGGGTNPNEVVGGGQVTSPMWADSVYIGADDPEDPNGIPSPVYKNLDSEQPRTATLSNNYVEGLPSVSADSVRLQTGDNGFGTSNPRWTGTEEVKITYVPNN